MVVIYISIQHFSIIYLWLNAYVKFEHLDIKTNQHVCLYLQIEESAHCRFVAK